MFLEAAIGDEDEDEILGREEEARCSDAAKEINVLPPTSIPYRRDTILRLRVKPAVSRLKTVTLTTCLGLNSPSR